MSPKLSLSSLLSTRLDTSDSEWPESIRSHQWSEIKAHPESTAESLQWEWVECCSTLASDQLGALPRHMRQGGGIPVSCAAQEHQPHPEGAHGALWRVIGSTMEAAPLLSIVRTGHGGAFCSHP